MASNGWAYCPASASVGATQVGWMYLAAVLDLYSRRIVGWAMGAHQDETLVERALAMAVTHREPPEDLLHHSDRGCQYSSQAYQAFLKVIVGITR